MILSLLGSAACGSESPPAATSMGGAGQAGVLPAAGSSGASAGQAGGGMPGTGGTTSGAAGSSAGATPGGSAGTTGLAGGGGSGGDGAGGGGSGGNEGGGALEPGYTAPPRDIDIQRTGSVTHSFTPAQAAPGATSFHGGQQQARFNADATKIQKKLVIGLGGIGTGPHNGGGLGWAAERGYHTIGLDYYNANAGDQGNNYRESWSGEDVGDADVGPMNSIMNRVKTALTYLQGLDPGADWAYYLDAEGEVRWNDVIVFGYSFGAQTGAAGTKYVALHRLVATSGPGIPESATWVSMPGKTPGNRCFTISGTDDGGHENHMATALRLGWPGPKVETWTSAPPYNGSSLLAVDFGHSEFCSLPTNVLDNADEVCEFAFGYTP